ncbi:MAG: hypothetical protein WBP64_06240 [Nitrososphaeraceae archaeon]
MDGEAVRNFNVPWYFIRISMILFKRNDKDMNALIKCKYCNMKFEGKDRLKRHERKAHSERGESDSQSNPNPFGGF